MGKSEQLIYSALVRAAVRGERCPTADDLCAIIDSGAVSTTVEIVRRLEKRGLIVVQRYQRGRRVTIVATGQSTAEPKNTAIHWRNRPVSLPSPSLSVVRGRDPDVARLLLVAARRDGRAFSEFLADLVWEAAVRRGILDSPVAE